MYVFEGKPPELKIEQLKQRREKRDEADKELAAAKESGDQEAIEKYSKRTTKVRGSLRVEANCPLFVLPVAGGQCVAATTAGAGGRLACGCIVIVSEHKMMWVSSSRLWPQASSACGVAATQPLLPRSNAIAYA